jgi:glycosyltransferase involved in cell wall biosynthesis
MESKNDSPLISVVLATYNGSRFLAHQLESVIKQSYRNIEIIIVDDCSTDNTISIIGNFIAQDNRIQLFQNTTNLGYIKNFEKGCSLAKGKFIALCDQDDFWHEDKIRNCYESIGDHPMIYCDSVLCDEALQPIGVNISGRVNCLNFDNPLQQAVFCRIYGHATLIRKDFMQKAIPFLPVIPHDWWLCYLATCNGEIKYLPQPLAFYRQHSENIFGAAGGKTKKHNKLNKKEKREEENERIRKRMIAFYEACPDELKHEKKILKELAESYQSFSFRNNFKRMLLFFSHHRILLASKKRNLLRQWVFCLKMFVKIT